MKQKKIVFPLLIIIVVLLGAIATASFMTRKAQAAFLEGYGLAGMDVKAIVNKLDSTINEDPSLSSSINGEQLMLSDGKKSIAMDLPKDVFYLSFAPYENTTHPCAIHGLKSCRGELVNVPVQVKITAENGDVLIDQNLTTMENGFIGVWLPRNMQAELRVSYAGKSASAPISTYTDSDTCLTTALKLR